MSHKFLHSKQKQEGSSHCREYIPQCELDNESGYALGFGELKESRFIRRWSRIINQLWIRLIDYMKEKQKVICVCERV